MKPIIGVTPDFNAGNRKEWGGREPTYFLRARYIRAIEELGGVPLVLPLLADRADETASPPTDRRTPPHRKRAGSSAVIIR